MSDEKLSLLLVEDEEELLYNLENILSDHGYSVLTATNGIEALEILRHQTVDVVISDIRMPLMDGISLLKDVKLNYPEKYFILMTGFSQLLETSTAFDLGADDFLPKPFRAQDLIESMKHMAHRSVNREKRKNMDSHFQKVPIELLGVTVSWKCPVYFRLASHKYIKIANRAEHFSIEQLQRYKNNGIHELYVLNEDYQMMKIAS